MAKSPTQIQTGSLVLYKDGAALVRSAGKKKLEIVRDSGETLSVRHKDVELLHPGPLQSLGQLKQPQGEVKVAWELLAGSTTTLAELAELAYGDYTPSTAWAAWQLVQDGLYFQGEPGAVVVQTAEDVAQEEAARAEKEAEERRWQAFVERVGRGQVAADDTDYLRDIEALALQQFEQSRVLRDLGQAETPENAHAFLLQSGYWEPTTNPYPERLGLPATRPEHQLPDLPREKRVDLTHLPAIAIDDEGSRDADDAVSIEEGGPTGTRLWVHVADVAALVRPDSLPDLEARARGASLYLPEGTVPMLPPQATERLALGLEPVSPALSLRIDLEADGSIANTEIMASCIRVQTMSYAQAEARLEEPPLKQLYKVAQLLQERRRQAGAIDIDLPEVKVRVHDGEVVIRPLPNLRSRDLVREAMLIAGEAVARFALDHDIPIPFTVQDAPDVPEEGVGEGPAGQFALRRCFRRSQASATPGPHAGLGLPLYAQATSPLRRYLDLVVHQQLRAFRSGDPLLDEREILERVGAAEAVRGDVRYVERLANEHWTLVYLQQHTGWQGEGIIVEQYGQRSKVLIPELAYETQIYLRDQLRLNGTVRLQVDQVNLAERTAHFREAGD